MKKHREIQFGFGNLESAVKELEQYRESSEPVFGIFNGHRLESDVDDIDSAYIKVTGLTKAEFDDAEEKSMQEYRDRKKRHEDAIPFLTKEWIEKGNKILDSEYQSEWARCVPIRLSDLYEGMELGATLDIVKELNEGCDISVAKSIIEGQGHSGMSFGLVRLMVKSFCDRGEEFAKAVS